MKQKNHSICFRCILSLNKAWIFIGFCFILISALLVHLILHRNRHFSFQYQTIYLSTTEISLFETQTDRGMCTTKWYKQLNLEFNVFSVNNFEKVMFLMDDYYIRNINKDQLYKCVFFQYGRNFLLFYSLNKFHHINQSNICTNIRLEPRLLIRIGGTKISDPNQHTLCLQCQIPIEAVHPNAMTIHFMLISGDDYTNAVNISICRSYESSFSFVNSRIYLENVTELKLENKNENKSSSMIAACTQTSLYDLNFPLWINYHYKMGINHFYIYDHARSNQTRLHQSLKSYIDYNIITIVPWYIDQWEQFEHHSSPLDWISHQIWSENDCIHRYGYLYSWMLISDVDEFVVPMGELTNFRQVLDKVPPNYCALQVLNYNFRGLFRDPPVEGKDRPKMNVFREFKHSKRNENSKNFVRPHLIYYFAVHQVTLSVNDAPVFYADVQMHARLQHYRTPLIEPHELSKFVIDTRILSFLNSTTESLSSIISN